MDDSAPTIWLEAWTDAALSLLLQANTPEMMAHLGGPETEDQLLDRHQRYLQPDRPVYDPAHPLGCHRPRISDRIVFEKLLQVLRFGCLYAAIADCACGATTIRDRRREWTGLGVFAQLKAIARDSCDRIVGLVLEELAVDGCITNPEAAAQRQLPHCGCPARRKDS